MARDGPPRRALAGPQLPAGNSDRRGPGDARRHARHHPFHHQRDTVRAAGLLARPHAGDGVHLSRAHAAGVRCGRARRRLPHRLGARRRSVAASGAAARDADAHRRRRHGAIRAGRHAGRGRRSVHRYRAGQGPLAHPCGVAPCAAQRAHPGAHAAGAVAAGALFRRGVHRGDLRLARAWDACWWRQYRRATIPWSWRRRR